MKIYGLFQTDEWQSKDSYVNFGYFVSLDEAMNNAIDNNLLERVEDNGYFSSIGYSKITIQEFTLSEFGEDSGTDVRIFDYIDNR